MTTTKNLKSKGTKPKPNLKILSKTISDIKEDFFDQNLIKLGTEKVDDWLLKRNYIIGDTLLGSGGYGKVYTAVKNEWSEGSLKPLKIAVKVVEVTRRVGHTQTMNELYISGELMKQTWKMRTHDHIIKVYDKFLLELPELDHKWKAYFFMEMADRNLAQELEKNNGPFIDAVAKRYFAHVIYAISFIHGLGIAHRDLKLENFLVIESKVDKNIKTIKVTDFGFSRVHYTDDKGYIHTNKTGGTLLYKSPEILRVQFENSNESFDAFKADIWALGICLYRMLTNSFPFNEDQIRISKLKDIAPPFPQKIKLDKHAKDLIERMLSPDPDLRPKIGGVKNSMWLKKEISLTVGSTDQE